jgi:hypothetical protein
MISVGFGGKAVEKPLRQGRPSKLLREKARPFALPRPRTFFWLIFGCLAFWGVVLKLVLAWL